MQIFPDFYKAKVSVVGDIMLDRYYYGDVVRISPEAPVPVVNVTKEVLLPGGAANVAINLSALGAQTQVAGVVGQDESASQLSNQLKSLNVEAYLNRSHNKTIVKTRVMGGQQQLLRMDFEEKIPKDLWSETCGCINPLYQSADVIILSDYNKGTLANCQQVIQSAKEKSIRILVDPKGDDFSKYKGADLLTPNLSEFVAAVGEVNSEAELQQKAQKLISDLSLGALLVTRSEKGMTLFRLDQEEFHLPAITREVADVTGAGDTVIATLAAALAANANLEEAVTLANIAASIAVTKVGATAVSAPELSLEYQKYHQSNGLLTNEQLSLAVDLAKQRGEKVVFTNGCFDILHAGHVAYLNQAKALGDRLIVAINRDESVRKLKGEGRPINSEERRLAVLQGLESVDWVTCFDGDTPKALLEVLKPDVLVKGGDYSADQVVGKEIVDGYGGEVKVMSLVPECSTTRIIEKARS